MIVYMIMRVSIMRASMPASVGRVSIINNGIVVVDSDRFHHECVHRASIPDVSLAGWQLTMGTIIMGTISTMEPLTIHLRSRYEGSCIGALIMETLIMETITIQCAISIMDTLIKDTLHWRPPHGRPHNGSPHLGHSHYEVFHDKSV
jgi:hypothetical protein